MVIRTVAPSRHPAPTFLISTTVDSRGTAEALVETLLLRVLSYLQPGLAHIHVWDTGQLTGSLPGLYPLTRAGLLHVVAEHQIRGAVERTYALRQTGARIQPGEADRKHDCTHPAGVPGLALARDR